MRIGLGYDLHRLKDKQNGMIPCGGILLPSTKQIDGAHSDGDVVLHSLTDALLGINGLDIGQVFPNTDSINKNRPSIDFVNHALKLIQHSYRIINIDIVVICDNPKITPYRTEIRNNLSSILNIPFEKIMIKGKTTEMTRPDTIEAYTNVLFAKI